MSVERKSKKALIDPDQIRTPKFSPNIGAKEPLAHPCNCDHECPYGYDRAFCFPCMKKIMAEHREKREKKLKGYAV